MKISAIQKARDLAVQARAGVAKPKALMVREETDADTATLYFYDQIGAGWFGEGITAKDVVQALNDFKASGVKNVDVRILSEGGDVFEGKAIYEALKRCGMNVTTYNDGLAASAASFIAMAGKKVVSSPTATWMIHRAWVGAAGNCQDLRAMADILEQEDGTIASMYSAKTGMKNAQSLELMTAETWLNAEKAAELGFCEIAAENDDVEETDESASNSAIVRLAAATQKRIADANRERIAALDKKLSQSPRASPGARPAQAARK